MFDMLQDGYGEMDMVWTGMTGFNNTYGLIVASDIAPAVSADQNL